MTSAKAWYWMGLGVLVLSLGTSDTARCWADKASEVFGHAYARGRSYVAVAQILLGNSPASAERLQDQLARAEQAQDRLRAKQDLADAQLDQAQALVQEKLIRKQELLMSKAMRADRAVRALQAVRAERFAIPGRVLVGPDGVIVNGHRRVAVCPSQVEVDVPNIQMPDLSSLEVMPEAPRDPI